MSSNPSQRTLELAIDRIAKYLRGAGTDAFIFAGLRSAGYSIEHHHTGWRLYLKVCGYVPPSSAGQIPGVGEHAMVEVDHLDQPTYVRFDAAMTYNHPEQATFVLQDISPSTGTEAVANMDVMLSRVDQLESGEGRDDSTRDADLAAVATLADRGYTSEERARLRALVTSAQGVTEAVIVSTIPAEEHDADMLALYGWWREWSKVARVVIRKKRQLQRLGLASYGSSKPKNVEEDPDVDADNTIPVVP